MRHRVQYVVDGKDVSFDEWLFGDDAQRLIKDHVHEFVITSNEEKAIHLTCGWVRKIYFMNPWALRALAIGHLRRGCE